MNSFSNYGGGHSDLRLHQRSGAVDASMVKIGESRMSRMEDDDNSVTPIKKNGGDSDSS
jgi:hypothetical protein